MVSGERGKAKTKKTDWLRNFDETYSPRYNVPGFRIEADSGTGQGAWMEGFVNVFREAYLEIHRCGDEKDYVVWEWRKAVLIRAFKKIILGKEKENVRKIDPL